MQWWGEGGDCNVTPHYCRSMAFQSCRLECGGRSLLQVVFSSCTIYGKQNKQVTLKDDEIKYFPALVGQHGTVSLELINSDGGNTAVDPCWGLVIHRTPSPPPPPPPPLLLLALPRTQLIISGLNGSFATILYPSEGTLLIH